MNWKIGFAKMSGWNKGLTKETDVRVLRNAKAISSSMKRKKNSFRVPQVIPNEEILEFLYLKYGWSIRETAQICGVTPRIISKLLKDYNIPRRVGFQKIKVPELILKFLCVACHYTTPEIAEILGISSAIISRRLKEYNVKLNFRTVHKPPRIVTKETRDKISKANKGKVGRKKGTVMPPEFGEKVSLAIKNSPKYQLRVKKKRFPTKGEQRIIDLIIKYELPLKYVGNKKLKINHHNPDFITLDNKGILEVLGEYWHLEAVGKTKPQVELEYTEAYERAGYKCIIVWWKDIMEQKDWELYCLTKIREIV